MNQKETYIPLPLAKFATHILASNKYFAKITPIVSEESLPIRQSKFLGIPYWPKNPKEFPLDKNKIPMRLVAQINLEELHRQVSCLKNFPLKGIIQFFLPQYSYKNQYWGLCFDDHGKVYNDISVIYHERVDLPNLISEELQEIHLTSPNDFPMFKECKLEFSEEQSFCSLVDYYSSEYFYHQFLESLTYYEQEVFNTASEFNSTGCKLDGYAYFTKSDPRLDEYDFDNPWILLLQIDSVEDINGEPVCMWGNSGVANWFIRKNDLMQLDFSKVLFNWDCV